MIQNANREGWLRSLAYFTCLKSLYKNNTVYNYSLPRLASLIHVSPGALRHHLQLLEQEGLIRYTGKKNITFIGVRAMLNLLPGSTKKLTNVTVDFKNQLTLLRGKILQLNLNQQHNILRKSETINSPGNLQVVSTNERISNYVGLSCEGLGRLIGYSKATGQRVRNGLKALNIIECHRVIQQIGEAKNREHFNKMKRAEIFSNRSKFYNGVVFVDRPPIIEYLDTNFPLLRLVS